MFLRWQWLALHLSRQDASIIPNVISETNANPIAVYTIFSQRLEIQPPKAKLLH